MTSAKSDLPAGRPVQDKKVLNLLLALVTEIDALRT
jgi:hypothetical protein